ncbi:hypothetical protein GWK48_02365 [Metallosphaera tengchongensis]|uniref:Uncharacterized protein n=1 Tax=Metallosphaera tengchongensis TaxID=1532350 RepID=A0A6N0NW97_9CREN|nr:hypothetical protein [Metallosphaera tengchongensis]QKQ99390.1 hypothetical protein GWK48_02365 [Metallosphaera tengchongensis]
MSNKLQCLTCGRPFPEGQGVTFTLIGKSLEFHSKACAYAFLKDLVLSISEDCISPSLRDIESKYEDRLEKYKKGMEKKI